MKNDSLIIRSKRPKGEDGYKVFSIRVRDDLVDRLDDIVAESGRSRNWLIGEFLEYAIDRCIVVGSELEELEGDDGEEEDQTP